MIELHQNKCILSLFFDHQHSNQPSKLFVDTVRNSQLFASILEYLEISDLLSIANTCKFIKQIVSSNCLIQNKILRARVQYLKSANKKSFPFLPIVEQLPHHLIFDGDFRKLLAKEAKMKQPSGTLKGSINQLSTNLNNLVSYHREKHRPQNKGKQTLTKGQKDKTPLLNQIESMKRIEIEQKQYEDSMNWRVRLVKRMELSRSDLDETQRKERQLLGKLQNDINSKHYKIIEPDDSCYLTKVTFWDRMIYRFHHKF